MTSSSVQREGDTLQPLENQINVLTSLIERRKAGGRFPTKLESEYQAYRLRQFFSVDLRVIISGLLVFVVFGWADFSFGGPDAVTLFSVRVLIAVLLLLLIIWLPRSGYARYSIYVLVSGIYLCFTSVLWNISVVDLPWGYFYHLGMIPMQVFALLGLRSNYRAMLSCSVAMLLSYGAFIVLMPGPDPLSEVDVLAIGMAPYYLLFWTILVIMASYLSYTIESGTRTDYIKNRLLALEADRLQYLGRRLQQLSTTDSLTGIANRRYAETHLADEWRRCLRSNVPLAVLMIDVDLFKSYNDQYGHQQGDECLRKIAQKMSEFCRRPGDVCARYGGEEFVILLPETTLDQGCDLAQELCDAVAGMNIPHAQSPFSRATISIGVAAEIPRAGDHYEGLLKKADIALYQAKNEGRNQIKRQSVTDY